MFVLLAILAIPFLIGLVDILSYDDTGTEVLAYLFWSVFLSVGVACWVLGILALFGIRFY